MKTQKKGKYKILFSYPIHILHFLVLLHLHHSSSSPIEFQGRDRHISISQLEAVIKRVAPNLTEERKQIILNCAQTPPVGCFKVEKILILNEILFRDQLRGIHKPCNDTEHRGIPIIPPYIETRDGFYAKTENGIDMASGTYTKWVEKLIDSGLIFCDPFQHIYCSKQKKCTCLPGLVEFNGVCIGPVGSYCYSIYKFYAKDLHDGIEHHVWRFPGMEFFNPFNFRHTEIETERIETRSCPRKPFPYYSCELSNYFPVNPVCTDPKFRNITADLDIYFKQLLPRLGFNEICNLKKHFDLYTISKDEELNPEIRINNTEFIKENNFSYCDLRKLLICSPKSSKCECIQHTTFDTALGMCVLKSESQNDICKYLYHGPHSMENNYSLIPLARDDFRTGRDAQPIPCKGNFICTEYYDGISYCSCPKNMAGQNCDEALTRFIEIIKPTTFARDILDYNTSFTLFNELNTVAVKFDAQFKLEIGSQCNFTAEREAYRRTIPIKLLDLPNTTMTAADYTSLIESMTSASLFGELCEIFHDSFLNKSLPLLKCKLPNSPDNIGTCYRAIEFDHAEDLINILKSHQTLKHGAFCPPDVPEDPYSYQTDKMFFNTLEKHWANNTQFCNKTAGLICNSNNSTNIGTCSPLLPPTTSPLLLQTSLGSTTWPEYGSVWKSYDILIESILILLFVNMFH